MEKLFDAHAHYTDVRFNNEYPGGAEALLHDIMPSQVGWAVNVSTNLDNAAEVIEQSARYDGMFCAVGIHPTDIKPDIVLENEMERLRGLIADAKKNKIVSIGEIGFDYFWQPADREAQYRYFEAQMIIARETGLPVEIHDRDAHGDSLDMIRRFPEVKGVLHSFSGSPEMAKELIRRGWYISFSGVLTFKNARKTVEAAEAVPLERILIETDCPYLAPHPHRGELNHSGLMRLTAERLGELKGISTDEAVRATVHNASDFFNIPIV